MLTKQQTQTVKNLALSLENLTANARLTAVEDCLMDGLDCDPNEPASPANCVECLAGRGLTVKAFLKETSRLDFKQLTNTLIKAINLVSGLNNEYLV